MYQVPKWKRVALPENLFDGLNAKVDSDVSVQSGIDIYTYEDAMKKGLIEQAFQIEDQMEKHLGNEFLTYINGEAKTGHFIHAKSSDTIRIQTVVDALNVENNYILVDEGQTVKVVLDYISAEGSNGKHFGITRVFAKRGAKVSVVKVQRLAEGASFFDQCFTVAEENAEIVLSDIQMGAQTKVVAYESHLAGRRADTKLNSLYYGSEGEQLDLSFTMRHQGKHTNSDILSKGVLDGNSKKIFRGNLLFDLGSPQSVGREREYVTLLSEKVKSDSIPALLCSEDDVIGEHAASVGQVDQMKLFYLMSRGIGEMEAKKLVIKAAFEEILEAVNDEDIRASVMDALDRRLSANASGL